MSATAQAAQGILPLGSLPAGEVFLRIRNHLAGAHVGATRDAALLDQVLLCVFAKLHQALTQRGEESSGNLRAGYERALTDLGAHLGSPVLGGVALSLADDSLQYVDDMLSRLEPLDQAGDLVGDAYLCFVGSEARGQSGQFFTPTTAIRTLIALVDPKPGEQVIDPACGAGGFLYATARHLLALGADAPSVATSVHGIDKDAYLVEVARLRVSLATMKGTQVFVGDSLAWQSPERSSFVGEEALGSFDVVLTNPPFGVRIVASEKVRRQFVLAKRWTRDQRSTRLTPSAELAPSCPPQVLFLERCLSLVRQGGRVGIVVPESVLSGKSYRHVVQYVRETATVEAIIGMPEALFKTSGRGGTHTKTALLLLRRKTAARHQRDAVFMAQAAWCGHDSRGKQIAKDDTPVIVSKFKAWQSAGRVSRHDLLGYVVLPDAIVDDVLAPRAYDPELPALLRALETTHLLIRVGDLLDQRVISVTTGDEVGKLAYGSGNIPFVRTSDLSNWEIKLDPKHGVSQTIYQSLQQKQDVQENDILMVRDGTYLIGTCAIVTKYDTKIVFQSHLYKVRVKADSLLDAPLLLALLSSPLVQRQIRALSQTQDIIDSLGERIRDIVLPIPKGESSRSRISELVTRVVAERVEARELVRSILEELDLPTLSPDSG